ncbi:MAG: hypothetical protein ACI9G5_000237 [Paracoccaceae bacterium]
MVVRGVPRVKIFFVIGIQAEQLSLMLGCVQFNNALSLALAETITELAHGWFLSVIILLMLATSPGRSFFTLSFAGIFSILLRKLSGGCAIGAANNAQAARFISCLVLD